MCSFYFLTCFTSLLKLKVMVGKAELAVIVVVANMHYNSKLFIALLLQGLDAMMSEPIHLQLSRR